MAWFGRGLEVKTPDEIDLMRRAGLVVGRTLELLRESARPGLRTADLDTLAEQSIRDQGAAPSFLGYQGFPASICVSVNDEVVHGIPGTRMLVEGDLVSVDCGAIVEGWHGDAAVSFALGEVSEDVSELMRVTEEAMWRGIGAAAVGGRVGDISAAVQSHVEDASQRHGCFGIVPDYTGHGIGSAMHLPPDVPNLGRPGRGARLVEGLALAVEPMVTLGSARTDVLADDWTVRTSDRSWAAHFEHTFVLTDTGTWVLTALDGGEAALGALGVAFGGR